MGTVGGLALGLGLLGSLLRGELLDHRVGRRAGRFWPPQPVAADVTEKQLAELKADKRIAVMDGAVPVDR